MNKWKKAIVVILTLVFVLTSFQVANVGATPATRERLEELQQRDSDARQTVRDAEQLLTSTQAEIATLIERMQYYDQRLMDAAYELELIERDLLEAEIRKYYAEIDLEIARAERDEHYKILQARLRAMHEHGQVSALEVLFQTNSFTEFLSRLEDVRAVAQFDQDLLRDLQTAEQRYLDIVDQISREIRIIELLYATQELAVRDLNNLLAQHNNWMMSLADNAAYQEALVTILEQEQQAIYWELQGVRQVYQQEVAAAERERLRQEAARREAERQAALARLNNFDGDFLWPVPSSANISSPFGNRVNPITRRTEHHTGIDISRPPGGASIHGNPIVAAAEGIVRFAGWNGGFGNMIIIDHANGYSTLYAHNARNHVYVGQHVTRGQHIADIGSTGQSTGPHLHFEIRHNNVPRNPMNYFS